jgi:hypothetical protein
MSDRAFNGKILLRTEPELHRKAALQAAVEVVSLSRWILRQIESAMKGLPALLLEVCGLPGPQMRGTWGTRHLLITGTCAIRGTRSWVRGGPSLPR